MAVYPAPSVALAYGKVLGFTATPGDVNGLAVGSCTATIVGLATDMFPIVLAPNLEAGLFVLGARVTAKNTLTVYIFNATAGTLTGAAQAMKLVVL